MPAERLAAMRARVTDYVMTVIAGPRPRRVGRLTPAPRRDLLTDEQRIDLRQSLRFVLQKALREHEVRTELHTVFEVIGLTAGSDVKVRRRLAERRDALQKHLEASALLTDGTIDEFLDDVLTHAVRVAAQTIGLPRGDAGCERQPTPTAGGVRTSAASTGGGEPTEYQAAHAAEE